VADQTVNALGYSLDLCDIGLRPPVQHMLLNFQIRLVKVMVDSIWHLVESKDLDLSC
jgi:hypothetical protein